MHLGSGPNKQDWRSNELALSLGTHLAFGKCLPDYTIPDNPDYQESKKLLLENDYVPDFSSIVSCLGDALPWLGY